MLYQPVCLLACSILQCYMKNNVNFNPGTVNTDSVGCSTKLQCLVVYISDRRCLVTKPTPSGCGQHKVMKSISSISQKKVLITTQKGKTPTQPFKSLNKEFGNKTTQEGKTMHGNQNLPQTQDSDNFRPEDKTTQERETMQDGIQNLPQTPDTDNFRPEDKLTQERETMQDGIQNLPQTPDTDNFRPEDKLTQERETMQDGIQNLPQTPDTDMFRPESTLTQERKINHGTSRNTASGTTKTKESSASDKESSGLIVSLFNTGFDIASTLTQSSKQHNRKK